MEGRRFDSLAKRVASTADRRQLLAGLGGMALGSIGLLSATGVASAQVEAEDGLRKCKNKCEDRFCAGWEDLTKQRRCERRCKRECRRHH